METTGAQLVQILEGILSPNNAIRGPAEAAYNQVIVSNPNELVLGLLAALSGSYPCTAGVPDLGAVLLRRSIERGSGMWSDRLSAPTRTAVQTQLLHLIESPTSEKLGRLIGHLVSELAVSTLDTGGWPNLLETIANLSCDASKATSIRVGALSVLSKLFEYLGQSLIPQLPSLQPVVLRCLQDPEPQVQRTAVKALCALLVQHPEPKSLSYLVPSLVAAMGEAAKVNDEDWCNTAMQDLIPVAEKAPQLFRKCLVELSTLCVAVASHEGFEDSCRTSAVELMLQLCVHAPAMVRRRKDVTAWLVSLSLRLIAAVEDADAGWPTQEESSSGVSDTEVDELAAVGEEMALRLGRALGGPAVLPHAMPLLGTYATGSDGAGIVCSLPYLLCSPIPHCCLVLHFFTCALHLH